MDIVTQQNAASAEESASASEEMSAQAESMLQIVGKLVVLVRGAGRGHGSPETSGPHRELGQPPDPAASTKYRHTHMLLADSPAMASGDFQDF